MAANFKTQQRVITYDAEPKSWLAPYVGWPITVMFYSNRTDIILNGVLTKRVGKKYVLKYSKSVTSNQKQTVI